MMIARVLIPFVLLLAGQAAWAQADKGLPAPGATITLKPTPSGYEGGIPIARDAKYTGANISTADPTLAAILDKRIDKEELPARPAPANAPPPEPPKAYVKLVTVVLTSGAIRQGSYPLTLIVTGEGEPQVRDLTVVVPPARIDAPDTLVVVNERGRWIRPMSANQPQIWETTQRAWLTNLSLEQKGNTEADGRPAGRIVSTNRLANIAPGHSELIQLDKQFSLAGHFPLGTAKGKLVLQADQFSEPVTFGFEVRSRIWVCWLFVPMAIGLALGFITRIVLTRWLQLNQERENTYALIALINRARQRNADADFQAATSTILQDAQAAANKKKPDQVKDATTTQQTAFQAALDALAKRRGDLDKDIVALLAIARGYYDLLPTALAAAITETKQKLEAGLPGLDDNNVAAANQRLQEIRNHLRDRTKTAGREWVDATAAVTPVLDPLLPLQPAAIADLKTFWRNAHDPVTTAVQQLENDVTGSLDRVQAVLQTLHVGANALRNVTVNFAALIKGTAAGWSRVLAAARLPRPAPWQAWRQNVDALAAALEAASPTEPGAVVIGLRDVADTILGDLKGVLVQQIAEAAKQQELRALLDANKLGEAVTLVAVANPADRAQRHDEGRTLGPAPGTTAAVDAARAVAPVVQFSPAATAFPAGSIGFTTAPRADVTPVDVLAAAAQRNVQTTNLWLSLIYAALIASAGYFLFADRWIGVPLDFALVFFWAYATDIGADAATNAAKGVKRG